jgi:hypothetical protein
VLVLVVVVTVVVSIALLVLAESLPPSPQAASPVPVSKVMAGQRGSAGVTAACVRFEDVHGVSGERGG